MSSSKSRLRAELGARRQMMSEAHPDAASIMAGRAADWLEDAGWECGTVAGYWPMRSELSPIDLMSRLTACGSVLALPALEPGDAGLVMRFRLYTPEDALIDGPMGTRQPAPSCPDVVPDLILTPLLAFDARGYRLGYGGGFYDRALADLRSLGTVRAAGIAYAAQACDGVPTEVHDQALDAIFTEQFVLVPESH